jgi:HK97 family phage major capsid protein
MSATTQTAEQKAKELAEKAAAKKLVETVENLEKALPGVQKSLEDVKSMAEAMKKKMDGYGDIDVANVAKQVEQIRADNAALRSQIRKSKGGLYIPGLEDEADKFSLTKAMCAFVTKKWDNAGFEHEVYKAVAQRREKVGHISGVDSAGGFFVPDQVIPDVIQAIYTRSVLIGLEGSGQTRVSVIDNLVGNPVKIPKFQGGMIAYWVGEQDKYAETQSKVGNVTMTPRKLGLLTRMTDEIMRMQSYGLENLIRNDMVRAAAKLIDWTVIYGTGTENMPRGVANMPGINIYRTENGASWLHSPTVNVTNSAGGELTFDGLMNMQGVLEDQDLAVGDDFAFIAPPIYWRRIKQLKVQFFSGQTSNQAYLVGVPFLTDERLLSLVGPFDRSTQLASKGTSGKSLGWTGTGTGSNAYYGDVVGANWNDVIVGRWSGIEITDDKGEGSGFVSDQTFVKLRTYLDVGHRQEKNVVLSPDVRMRDA